MYDDLYDDMYDDMFSHHVFHLVQKHNRYLDDEAKEDNLPLQSAKKKRKVVMEDNEEDSEEDNPEVDLMHVDQEEDNLEEDNLEEDNPNKDNPNKDNPNEDQPAAETETWTITDETGKEHTVFIEDVSGKCIYMSSGARIPTEQGKTAQEVVNAIVLFGDEAQLLKK